MTNFQPPGPLTRFGIFVLISGVVLVGAFWGILRYLSDSRKSPPRQSDVTHASITPGPTAAPSTGPTPTPGVSPSASPTGTTATSARLNERVSLALAVLRDTSNPNKKEALQALKEALHEADPKVAVGVIRQFLAGREDAKTGLGFRIGDDHELDEAPTMRTFMMDQLGNISLEAGLGDAVEEAKATLATKDSADEWAVAMRNVALADPDGSRGFLAGKVRELLEYGPWRQTPSGGFQEAFDIAAYTEDPSFMAYLEPIMSTPNSLQRAAQVTMSRLSALAPEEVAAYLNANPSLLANQAMHRADYMGNLDLSSPGQLAQAEAYLARTDVTDAEKSKFIAREGMPAGFVSNTLVTPETIASMFIVDHRAVVNQAASTWLTSGKYPTLAKALQDVIVQTKDAPATGGE